MTEKLRELFADMVADEPPIRIDADEAEAAGRRLQARRRTLWTIASAATAVTLAVSFPVLIVPRFAPAELSVQSGTPGPGVSVAPPAPSTPALATPATSPSTTDSLTQYTHCPRTASSNLTRMTTTLPDPGQAAAAVLAAATRLAPGEKFVVHTSTAFTAVEKLAGLPQVVLIFDVGTERAGYGSVNIQILPSLGLGPPSVLAEDDLNRQAGCTKVTRRDFADGAVALYYPYGPPAQEVETTHVWYYAAGGYTMNIGAFPRPWSTETASMSTDPAVTLPARGSQVLAVDALMDLADVVAHC